MKIRNSNAQIFKTYCLGHFDLEHLPLLRISDFAPPGATIIELVIKIPTWLEKLVVVPLLWYRRLRYGYPFRRIRLSQGKYAIVDPDDYPRLSKYKWHAAKHTRCFYAMRTQWSGKLRRTVTIMMHREIMHAPEGMVIDHINHNGLDNRKANLRICTPADNARNARYPKINTSSKYRGVWYNRGITESCGWTNRESGVSLRF